MFGCSRCVAASLLKRIKLLLVPHSVVDKRSQREVLQVGAEPTSSRNGRRGIFWNKVGKVWRIRMGKRE